MTLIGTKGVQGEILKSVPKGIFFNPVLDSNNYDVLNMGNLKNLIIIRVTT